MPMTPLADVAYLERYLSAYGISTWTEHGEHANPLLDQTDEIVEDCLTYASGLLAGRLAQRYDYATLITVPMLAEVHCVITLWKLTHRRGNPVPASLEQDYQDIVQREGLLDQIAKGQLFLVDESGNPVRMKNANTPKHANLQVDRRFSERRVRVVTGSSNTEPSKLRRDFDRHIERDQW